MYNRSNMCACDCWGLRRRSLQDGVERHQLTGPSSSTSSRRLRLGPGADASDAADGPPASSAASSAAPACAASITNPTTATTTTATTRSLRSARYSQTRQTSADTSLGAPSPSFASSSTSGTEPRYHSYPSQGCCADCATWSSHDEEQEKTEQVESALDNDDVMDIDDDDEDDDDDDLDVELADLDDETSLESSSASGLKNDNSSGWVRSTTRPISSSLRSQYHQQRHRAVEPTISSPSVSYREPVKSADSGNKPKSKKSISSSLRSRFSSSRRRRNSPRNVRSIANGLKLAQTQAIAVAGFLADVDAAEWRVCDTCFSHRASYHGKASWRESNGSVGAERLSHSLPGSPADRKPNFEVIGSAESLVGRVLVEQGLGKYCDPEFVRYTSREMQEALDMTREEMDRAAHQLLLRERRGQPLTYQLQQPLTSGNTLSPPLPPDEHRHQQSWARQAGSASPTATHQAPIQPAGPAAALALDYQQQPLMQDIQQQQQQHSPQYRQLHHQPPS